VSLDFKGPIAFRGSFGVWGTCTEMPDIWALWISGEESRLLCGGRCSCSVGRLAWWRLRVRGRCFGCRSGAGRSHLGRRLCVRWRVGRGRLGCVYGSLLESASLDHVEFKVKTYNYCFYSMNTVL
jgi:hypothetical protein